MPLLDSGTRAGLGLAGIAVRKLAAPDEEVSGTQRDRHDVHAGRGGKPPAEASPNRSAVGLAATDFGEGLPLAIGPGLDLTFPR